MGAKKAKFRRDLKKLRHSYLEWPLARLLLPWFHERNFSSIVVIKRCEKKTKNISIQFQNNLQCKCWHKWVHITFIKLFFGSQEQTFLLLRLKVHTFVWMVGMSTIKAKVGKNRTDHPKIGCANKMPITTLWCMVWETSAAVAA